MTVTISSSGKTKTTELSSGVFLVETVPLPPYKTDLDIRSGRKCVGCKRRSHYESDIFGRPAIDGFRTTRFTCKHNYLICEDCYKIRIGCFKCGCKEEYT
jgi:hypothetical protein